jgi:hypothetical protein
MPLGQPLGAAQWLQLEVGKLRIPLTSNFRNPSSSRLQTRSESSDWRPPSQKGIMMHAANRRARGYRHSLPDSGRKGLGCRTGMLVLLRRHGSNTDRDSEAGPRSEAHRNWHGTPGLTRRLLMIPGVRNSSGTVPSQTHLPVPDSERDGCQCPGRGRRSLPGRLSVTRADSDPGPAKIYVQCDCHGGPGTTGPHSRAASLPVSTVCSSVGYESRFRLWLPGRRARVTVTVLVRVSEHNSEQRRRAPAS